MLAYMEPDMKIAYSYENVILQYIMEYLLQTAYKRKD